MPAARWRPGTTMLPSATASTPTRARTAGPTAMPACRPPGCAGSAAARRSKSASPRATSATASPRRPKRRKNSGMAAQISSAGDSAPPYAVTASPGFAAWLYEQNVALAVTTYQIGKLFLVGAPAPDRLSVTERNFERCLGVAAAGHSLYLAGLN